MKQILFSASLILILGLSACAGKNSSPPPLPTLVLDSATAAGSSAQTVNASAKVVALSHAELTFTAGGQIAMQVNFGEKVQAGQVLAALDSSAIEAQISSAEGALLTAQADLNLLMRFAEARERIESARGRVQQAQGALDVARANLATSQLIAPFDGTIIEVRAFSGQNVLPGQVIVVLADLNHFVVETSDLSERDIAKIKSGQTATVFIEALNITISAHVASIALSADSLGGDVIYKVSLTLDEQPVGLLWGMSAEVEISVE